MLRSSFNSRKQELSINIMIVLAANIVRITRVIKEKVPNGDDEESPARLIGVTRRQLQSPIIHAQKPFIHKFASASTTDGR